jgi:hypothetical protein
MANSRLYKIAHPGHDGDYNGGLEVHSSPWVGTFYRHEMNRPRFVGGHLV